MAHNLQNVPFEQPLLLAGLGFIAGESQDRLGIGAFERIQVGPVYLSSPGFHLEESLGNGDRTRVEARSKTHLPAQLLDVTGKGAGSVCSSAGRPIVHTILVLLGGRGISGLL